MRSTTSSGKSGRAAGVRAMHVRSHNLSTLAVQAIFTPTPLSRAELADATGLNRSTVTRQVDTLISMGILTEHGVKHSSSGGRPSVPLHPSPRTHVAIGVEISPTHLQAILMDLRGETLAVIQQESELYETQPADLIISLASVIEQLLVQATAQRMSIVGITVGLSGLIDKEGKHLVLSPNLGWRDVPLQELLVNALKDLPRLQNCDLSACPILFENSASLSALAERIALRKQSKESSNFLLVNGTSGIGACIVRNGIPEVGLHGWAGEFGHVYVSDEKSPCKCGASGCLESFVAFEPLMVSAGLTPSDTLSALLSKLRKGDKTAVRAVKRAAELVGRALSTFLNLADTNVVVFGGILGELLPYIHDDLIKELSTRVLSFGSVEPRIQKTIVDDAVANGAAWRTLTSFLDDPSRWQEPSSYAINYHGVEETSEVLIDD